MSTKYKALIIDDEPLARNIIKSYLKPWANIEVVEECSNGFEALKAVREHQPDLMFLDIQMPKVNGLELMEVIDDPVHVVFTTAYDQYALKAFELNAVDYLLKPFNEKRFANAVQKVLQKLEVGENYNNQQIQTMQDQAEEKLERIVVKKGSKLEVIPLDDILYLEAQDDYVMIYTNSGHFLKAKTMKYFENHLPTENFIRIHRSYLVNAEKIKRLEPYNKDTQLAVINDDCKLKVSRTGYKKLKEVLDF
ncbi:LytR/AlgR family response regulator transcription factor [Carboxylicivirga linearis]|uniref:Response regulator transcription factor n=1 Tax=Carboxylicivirga linearis TaxID=1628157 RepID=A0ABS5JRF5_9BACT|nr:LytTR family DNA-binding domain-containing protein [Carboxylicivirga linearis]MBS2096986.1 response regulator transcription factor [Carboxylicivirga linearis]